MIVDRLQTVLANIKSLSNSIERIEHEVSIVAISEQMELVAKLILLIKKNELFILSAHRFDLFRS